MSRYQAVLDVDGIRFPALVDTGATVIALPVSIANTLGIHPAASAFTRTVTTANGPVKVAPIRLQEVHLDTITVRDVEAVIVPDASLGKTLLGMSFLKKLKNFSIQDETLTLAN